MDEQLNKNCERFFDIVEADRPSNEDTRFAKQHVKECRECAGLELMLREMTSVPLHEKQIEDELIKGAVNRHFSGQRNSRIAAVLIPLFATAAAILVAINIGTGSPSQPLPTPSPVTIDALPMLVTSGELSINDTIAGKGSSVIADQTISSSTGSLLKSGDLLSVGIGKATSVTLKELDRKNVSLHLEQGIVAVHLHPGEDINLSVSTANTKVIVTGTIFSVEANDDNVKVEVVRGSVRVKTASANFAVKAGSKFRLKQSAVSPGDPEAESRILAMLEMNHKTKAPLPIAEKQLRPSNLSKKPTPPDVKTRTKAKQTEEIKVTPNELLRAARTCKANQNWDCAEKKYNRLIEIYPNRQEAATVLLPLAEINLMHWRKPYRALRYYEEYIKKAPNGSLIQEAYYGRCKALAALGDMKQETKALQDFLKKFPGSAYSGNVRARLVAISKKMR